MTIKSFFAKQIKENHLVQAAVMGGALSLCKSLPGKMIATVDKAMGYTLHFTSDQALYSQIVGFVSTVVINPKWSKTFAVHTKSSFDFVGSSHKETVSTLVLTLGFGRHYGMFHGTPVIIDRQLDQDAQGYKSILQLRFISRSRRVLETFSRELKAWIETELSGEVSPKVYAHSSSEWHSREDVRQRAPESLFLANQELDRVLTHIRTFEERKTWNKAKGIGHHTGIMLSGGPGTAKTSLIQAIATATGRDIYVLDLALIESPGDLAVLLSSNVEWRKALVTIEDIDATGADVQDRVDHADRDHHIPLSSLLNILDGISTPDDMIVIATTNHLDRLDPALTRPGRFDLALDLGPIGWSEFIRMVAWFEMDIREYTHPDFSPMNGAKMRALLLTGGVKAVQDYQQSLPLSIP